MAKTLKKWNGRAHGMRGYFYIAAYSQKQASELISKASGHTGSSFMSELRNYYSNCWGNPMDGIEPTEPCVYHSERYETPKRII